ncbi:MAG: enoyl-CoA hydratase [Acidimicrobiales bacterium]|nr:enoyl-CoA hydratase [Acidimicrobiales bacterium]
MPTSTRPRRRPVSDVVLYEQRGAVALLTLNRPQRLNAWTDELGRRYFDLLDRAADDPEVRVIVVTGAGRGFCAGADMELLQEIGAAGAGAGAGAGEVARDQRSQLHTLSIPKPVIAAINGACAGLGLVQALMCDLRFAAEGAKLTTAFSRRGLVAEHGVSWVLPRLVGPARALDLLLSGRVFLAEEAYELGVVNQVLAPGDLLAGALAYADDLALNCSPASMAAMKHQVYAHLEAGSAAALEESTRLMVGSFGAPDFAEGVASFLEKRPPAFPPLQRG